MPPGKITLAELRAKMDRAMASITSEEQRPTEEPPQPIPTVYQDITFRSKLEVLWAKWFDERHIKWDYEPSWTRKYGLYYLPDLWLEDPEIFVEIKRDNLSLHEKIEAELKMQQLSKASHKVGIIIYGRPVEWHTSTEITIIFLDKQVLHRCIDELEEFITNQTVYKAEARAAKIRIETQKQAEELKRRTNNTTEVAYAYTYRIQDWIIRPMRKFVEDTLEYNEDSEISAFDLFQRALQWWNKLDETRPLESLLFFFEFRKIFSSTWPGKFEMYPVSPNIKMIKHLRFKIPSSVPPKTSNTRTSL